MTQKLRVCLRYIFQKITLTNKTSFIMLIHYAYQKIRYSLIILIAKNTSGVIAWSSEAKMFLTAAEAWRSGLTPWLRLMSAARLCCRRRCGKRLASSQEKMRFDNFLMHAGGQLFRLGQGERAHRNDKRSPWPNG